MNTLNKTRNSNLELYRIIVMLSIVAHHYVVNSGLLGTISEKYFYAPSLFYCLFGMWGKTGINCFVLITGYFMCTSKITLRKFLKLILQVEFYNVAIGAVFFFSHYNGYTVKDFLLHLIPIKSVSDDFSACFILFWLTIPFLNILVKNMNQQQHLWLILLCVFIYTGMLYIPHSSVNMNYISWFIVLYFISSYIRLYPEAIYKSDNAKAWGWFSLMTIGLAISSVVMTCLINHFWGKGKFPYWLISDSNAILALLVGVTTFMFFKNLKMSHNKFINAVASTTFGVLLIHANSNAMRHWLWRDTIDCMGHYDLPYYYLYAPAAVLGVFAVCSAIDYVRIHTVETWFFRYYDKYWGGFLRLRLIGLLAFLKFWQ